MKIGISINLHVIDDILHTKYRIVQLMFWKYEKINPEMKSKFKRLLYVENETYVVAILCFLVT